MVAAEPPRRRCFAWIRRSLRLPSQIKGVGVAFQPATASSNQVINSFAVCGCCPRKARSQMMRCTDSAIFSHDPLIGVYSGMIPCANNQVTMSVLRCPARLSQTIQQADCWQRQVWHMSQPGRPVHCSGKLGTGDGHLRQSRQDLEQFIFQPGM
jgi:hypothetical protein